MTNRPDGRERSLWSWERRPLLQNCSLCRALGHIVGFTALMFATIPGYSAAEALRPESGSRLLATSLASSVEGGSGGGIVPWATIAGYGSDTEVGGSAFYSRVDLDDFRLDTRGVAVGLFNRVELSYARQTLDVDALGLAISQDVFGAKARIAGDLVYNALPQLSLGMQHKRNRDFTVPELLGAQRDSGTDVFVSASKLLLGAVGGYNVLLNGTVRRTEANQMGLLGFGNAGGRTNTVFEGSAAIMPNRHWAIGYEFREKPNALTTREDNWRDLFVAWFPSKRVSLVVAYADLGDIAGFTKQSGWYASFQFTH